MGSYVSTPNAGQSLGGTRDQMRTNTDLLKQSLAINHVDLGGANVGKHKFVQMPSQGSDAATAANEIATYVKGSGSATALYLRQQNNGSIYQMSTAVPVNRTNDNGVGSITNYSFIPSGGAAGLMLITGFAVNGKDGSTLDLGITTLAGIISIHLTALGSSSSGTNRALVAQPRTVNVAGGTMVINLQDVNNNDQNSSRTVYFTVIGF